MERIRVQPESRAEALESSRNPRAQRLLGDAHVRRGGASTGVCARAQARSVTATRARTHVHMPTRARCHHGKRHSESAHGKSTPSRPSQILERSGVCGSVPGPAQHSVTGARANEHSTAHARTRVAPPSSAKCNALILTPPPRSRPGERVAPPPQTPPRTCTHTDPNQDSDTALARCPSSSPCSWTPPTTPHRLGLFVPARPSCGAARATARAACASAVLQHAYAYVREEYGLD